MGFDFAPTFKNYLLLFFLVFNLQSQPLNAQSKTAAKDSLLYNKVLLVQFDTTMYLSDAEQEIMQQSAKQPEVYRTYLRKSLNNKIAAEVETIIPCYSLLDDESKQATLATAEIYGESSYAYAEPMKIKHIKNVKPLSTSSKTKANEDSKIAPQYTSVQGDAKYMNAAIQNKNVFEKLSNQYGVDLFLLINQFEIKTNYNNCIDIARQVYKREIIISYSIYNAEGKQLDGNNAQAFIASDNNRASDIAERTFPAIAESIASHIKALALK